MVREKEGREHKTRRVLYNYILSNPGTSFGVIKRFFDMNTSTLKYHLNYLERAKKIISKREGRFRCYYSIEHAGSETPLTIIPRANFDTLTHTQKRIIHLIRNKPNINRKELMNMTKLNRKNFSYNLKRLADLKFIWVAKHNGIIGYEYITREKLRNEMFNRLVVKLISNEIDEETFNKIKKKLESLDIEKIMK